MSSRVIVTILAVTLLAPAFAAAISVSSDDVFLVRAPLDAASATPVATHATVRIDRDPYGVPHVYADNVYGLFWGNGYAQAQDRLFQIDVLRHIGKGESARYLGPGQLGMDLATRRELYTDAERDARLAALPAEDRFMFQAFADGVNAWILETRADPSLLSAEFYAIGHAPEDWRPQDTIAIAEFLLDIFGAGSGGNEADNARLLFQLKDTLGDAEAERAFNDLYWMHDPMTYTTADPGDYVYPATEGPLDFDSIPPLQWEVARAAAEATPFAGAQTLAEAARAAGLPTKFGSNAIVIAPGKSENGAALLFGGPQMAYFNPMVPYEVALHGAGFDALGMGVGGAPGVIIGRTQDMAWTVTSGSSDQVDVVGVKLVDGEPRRYYVSGTSGATKDMDCRVEVHVGPPTAIDPNPPVLATQEVCRTDRGPVFAINEEAGWAFARERTHRGDELRSGLLWLKLAQADSIEAMQDHMESFCFEFNFHVAERDGDIAYMHFGCQPVRAGGYDPRLPRVAGEWDWLDVRSGRELPHVVNPTKGTIVNWNNKPALGWSSGDAQQKWGPLHRAELIERALANHVGADGKWSMEELHAVNREISTRSPFPAELVPLVLASTAGATDPVVQAARAELAAWNDGARPGGPATWMPDDATCSAMSDPDPCFGTMPAGFTLYEAWRLQMQKKLFADEMGALTPVMETVPETSGDPHAADFGREDNKDNTLANALRGLSAHDWCDDVTTGTTESCDDVVSAAFEAAAHDLHAQYGSTDPADWRGDAKTIKFVGLSGGPAWRIAMVNRPSYNHYYDFGTDDAGSVLPPGTDQSWMPVDFLRYNADGTLPDAHKRDQLDLYVSFAFKPADMTPVVATSETHDPYFPWGYISGP